MSGSDDARSIPAQSRAVGSAGPQAGPFDLGQDVGVAGSDSAVATAGEGRQESSHVIFPAFDAHHAPPMALLDDCVHCGFCLPSCPTYVLFGEEMDSPRGRIHLMRTALEGEPLTESMVRHFDLCLGCLACVSACPSGVQYDKLIESTRQQVERRYPRSLRRRVWRELLYALFPHPERLSLAIIPLMLYQRTGVRSLLRKSGVLDRLPEVLRTAEAIMPDLSSRGTPVPEWTPAVGVERYRVGLLRGCVQRVFFGDVNAATVRVLSAEGCGVTAPLSQRCCGALSEHAGREEEALRFARRTIDAFDVTSLDAIIVNVAGCGSMMKEYGYLLRDDPVYAERAQHFSEKVRDVSEFLCELQPVAQRYPLPISVVYHDACHLAHGQQIRRQPRDLLRQIPQLDLREVPREREICCGSAGTYNLLEPQTGRELGDRKAASVLEAEADLLVTANPGCHLQIEASLRRLGKELPARHVVEVLDASIRGASAASLLN